MTPSMAISTVKETEVPELPAMHRISHARQFDNTARRCQTEHKVWYSCCGRPSLLQPLKMNRRPRQQPKRILAASDVQVDLHFCRRRYITNDQHSRAALRNT